MNMLKISVTQIFFEYQLKEEFEVDIDDLDKIMLFVHSNLKKHIEITHKRKTDKLKKFFNVSVLQPYHHGLQPEENPDKRVSAFIKTPEQIVDIAKHTYQCMGFDIDCLIRKTFNTRPFSEGEKEYSRI